MSKLRYNPGVVKLAWQLLGFLFTILICAIIVVIALFNSVIRALLMA